MYLFIDQSESEDEYLGELHADYRDGIRTRARGFVPKHETTALGKRYNLMLVYYHFRGCGYFDLGWSSNKGFTYTLLRQATMEQKKKKTLVNKR